MTLTSPPTAVAPFDKGKLAAGITAAATTITVSPIYKTINGVRTKQGFDTTSGLAIISLGDFTERISFESASVDATTKITTLSTCVRGLSATSTTASFSGGTGRAWPKGAKIAVVADASYFQSSVFTNVANTFTANQTLATTNELRFASSATAVWKDGSGNLSLKDAANGTKTLTQLAAANGSDEKVKVTSDDTTGDYLLNKLAAGTGITITETNGGGNEDATIAIVDPVTVATGGSGRQTATAYAVICGGTTATGAHQSIASVGSANQVLLSAGAGALPAFGAPYVTRKCVYVSGATTTTLTNPTSLTAFDTHTYTIPANDLVAGVAYHFVGAFTVTTGTSGNVEYAVMLGSTKIAGATVVAINGSDVVHVHGMIVGTAAAGASVSVRGVIAAGPNTSSLIPRYNYETASVATNGELVLKFGALFGTSNGGNVTAGTMAIFSKESSTAFQ